MGWRRRKEEHYLQDDWEEVFTPNVAWMRKHRGRSKKTMAEFCISARGVINPSASKFALADQEDIG